MSTRQRLNATCERCGRRIEVHQGRKKAVIVCFDCRYSDPEYLRLRTSNACGARGFSSLSAVESQVPRPALATPNGAAPSTTARRLDGTL